MPVNQIDLYDFVEVQEGFIEVKYVVAMQLFSFTSHQKLRRFQNQTSQVKHFQKFNPRSWIKIVNKIPTEINTLDYPGEKTLNNSLVNYSIYCMKECLNFHSYILYDICKKIICIIFNYVAQLNSSPCERSRRMIIIIALKSNMPICYECLFGRTKVVKMEMKLI